ncbi:MAG: MBL fold metallo-hydrolase [Bacillota bacterium]|nr:MBL fold metallo-hydrolase [Bacillota bacterium]
MVITYHGADFFKVIFGNMTLAVNPVSKDSNIKSSRFGADIALISVNDAEHNGADAVSRTEKAPFIINGPGEYEVSGIFIKGFLSKTADGKLNTIYTVNMEGMNLCFLGSFGEGALPDTAKEATEDVDILFVPIGGEGALDAHMAEKISNQFEPKVIIPAHFEGLGSKDALKTFLKEAGSEGVKPVEKLTVKKKDIETMEGEVVVLSVA